MAQMPAPNPMQSMIPGATPSGAGSPDPADADSGQTVVTITDNGDGTYTVSQDDGDAGSPDPAGADAGQQPVTAQGIPAALKAAGAMLSGGTDAAGAWNQEAAARGPDGRRAPAVAPTALPPGM